MNNERPNNPNEVMHEGVEPSFYNPDTNTEAGRDCAEWIEDNSDIEIEQYRRACGYVRLFAHDKNVDQQLDSTVYDALLLQGLYEKVNSDSDDDQRFAQVLKDYVDARRVFEEETSVIKTLALCEDVLRVRSYYEGKTKELTAQGESEEDRKKMPPLYLTALKDLKKKVHVESFVLQAAIILNKLKYPALEAEIAESDVQAAESFYAPLMDALGLHAMAAELQSSCDILKLNSQGKEDVVLKAFELRKKMDGIDVPTVVKELLGLDDLPKIDWQIGVSSDNYEKGLNCYFGRMEFYAEGQKIDLEFRKKSIGRIARKLDGLKEGEELRDLFGIKYIVGDDNRGSQDTQRWLMGRLFVQTGLRMISDDNVVLSSTKPGVRSPFFVQGAESSGFTEFIEGISPESFRVQTCTKDYQVAKIMAVYKDKPLEVQFLTGSFYYNDDKRGPKNHALYRTGCSDDIPAEVVSAIYDGVRERKDHFGNRGHNSASLFAAMSNWALTAYRILQPGR